MANFCTKCGNPVGSEWNVCPYCGHSIYQKMQDLSQKPFTETPEYVSFPIWEESVKRGLTKSQKLAIIISGIVLIAAIVIPIVIFMTLPTSDPNFMDKNVQFYVNNGWSLTSYTVSTPVATFEFYEDEFHPSHSHWDPDYVASVIESYCTPNDSKVIEIAQAIHSKCFDQNDSEEVINALLSFTQAIVYKSDVVDLAQYPLETIYNQGDCEDMSILFGSLVEALGYDAVIFIINLYDEIEEDWFGHACVGVYLDFTPTQHLSYPPSHYFNITENSNEYWICETTSQGWMIGEIPTSDPAYYLMEGYAIID